MEWAGALKRCSAAAEVVQSLEAGRVAVPEDGGDLCRDPRVEEGCGPSRGSTASSRRTTRRSAALRHAVIWRRISGGTDSEAGSRFVERMLTVVATCRQQGANVLDYLSSCFEATRRSHAIPSLLLCKAEKSQNRLISPTPTRERLPIRM